jgi:DNA-binding HxlR family transcriptional regulator
MCKFQNCRQGEWVWCSNELLARLTRPWALQILCILSSKGPARFGVLRRRIPGISSRLLTERLRMLEQQTLVFRHVDRANQAVTYGITERVAELEEVLTDLLQLSKRWKEEDAGLAQERSAMLQTAVQIPPMRSSRPKVRTFMASSS